MSDEQANFKVTDRRLFNPDGSPRDIPREEQAPEPKPVAAESAPAAAAEPAVSAASPEPEREPSSRADREELPGADDPASFANFMMSIASNAASALGMMEHPVTGKRDVDLELGKHWIDILTMLKKKTQGNLAAQEQQILESLLADLQMQYVSLTHAASKSPRAFTGRDITGG